MAEATPTETTTAARATATRVQDERTGKYYLQGREEAVKGLANVFGNGDFMPLTWPQAYDKTLVFEAEVVYCFSAVADDNAFDRSEVFRFRLWGWSAKEGGAEPSVTMDWQDFNGDDPPGEPYGWNCLLIEAVERLREVRSGKALFTPLVVGAPSARA